MDLREIVQYNKRCVVLTGSGVSAESGIPTFRGKRGLWKQHRPEELATPLAFQKNPQLVWEWYNWRRDIIGKAEPNPAHYVIAEMEKFFDEFMLITQNIDGIHRKAGSGKILELHGNIWKNKCFDCGKKYDEIISGVPQKCDCGGYIRPDVVWFGESLDREILGNAFLKSREADIVFVLGTSGIVQPAASLPFAAKERGAYIVEINLERTPISIVAHEFIPGKAGEVMGGMR
ncbi:MAG: NAD-dependent deacylase, partial [Candidatus Cloacimonadota bacterium]